MNNQKERMNEFLNFWRDVAIENPHFSFDEKEAKQAIYHRLTDIGIPKEEQHKNIEYLFQEWINYFHAKNNIKVYVSPDWRYFCQFHTRSNDTYNQKEHIKVYIPLDSEHINFGAKIIFDYLRKNNIPHMSKISKVVRFDDIVVRLINPEDADKLIWFVKNNTYLQQGLLPSNPFAYNKDNIALASDGELSYNSTIANYIRIYIRERKKEKKLGNVNINDFLSFIINYYNVHFIDKKNIDEFLRDFDLPFNTSSKKINNYMNVTELFIKIHSTNFSYKKYMDHYRECMDTEKQQAKEKEFENVRNNVQKTPHERIKNTNEILIQTLSALAKQYNKKVAIANMVSYLRSNNASFLPNDQYLKEQIIHSDFRNNINQLLQKINMSLEEYINFYHIDIQESPQFTTTMTEEQITQTMNEALKLLTERFNNKTAVANMVTYIYRGETKYLTSRENLRNRIAHSTFRQDVLELIKRKNVSVETFVTSINNSSQNQFDDIVKKNLLKHYQEYDDKYRLYQQYGIIDSKASPLLVNGEPIDGTKALRLALWRLLYTGSFQDFTPQNGVQRQLEQIPLPKIVEVLRKDLKIPNHQYISEEEINYILDQYPDMIAESQRNKHYW